MEHIEAVPQLTEWCCNCGSFIFETMPDGQRRCSCGLWWRNQPDDRPPLVFINK